VGEILYAESSRLGIGQPYLAPTILDGGVAKFTTGEVVEQVISGFLRAAGTESALRQWNASGPMIVTRLTYLAGAKERREHPQGSRRRSEQRGRSSSCSVACFRNTSNR
jgi:hypothetical protein